MLQKRKILEAVLLALSVMLTAIQSSTKETKSSTDNKKKQHYD